MVVVNPGNGTDSEANQFINDMKEEYNKGKEKVTKWKNNLIDQASGYTIIFDPRRLFGNHHD